MKTIINQLKKLFFIALCFYSSVAFSKVDSTIFSEDSIRYFIENDSIRVGFDKRMGGAISYFVRKSNGQNLINNYDAGRQAGFETRIYPANPTIWKPFPSAKYLTDVYPLAGGASREWNGLPSGSFYNQFITNTENLGGMPEKVHFDIKTGVLYIKSKLWEWGFVNEVNGINKKIEAGANNEYWINLEGIAANFTVKQVRNIPYFVSNTTTGASLHIFINLNKSFSSKWQTYNSTNPYTNQTFQTRTSFLRGSPNNANFWSKPTENWLAMTDQNNFGMGIYTKDTRFSFQYAEKQVNDICTEALPTCQDEQKYSFTLLSLSTYGFPCSEPCTTPNSSSTLSFSFLAGTATEIRQFAYQNHTNPCVDIMALSSKNDDFSINSIMKSKVLIDANNKILTANTIYQTGNSIYLNPGFKVANGAVFDAKITPNPCQ